MLALLGGAIEILQGTTLIAGDAEFLDWAADVVGILVAAAAGTAAAIMRHGRTAGTP
jgi:hypothetical protein